MPEAAPPNAIDPMQDKIDFIRSLITLRVKQCQQTRQAGVSVATVEALDNMTILGTPESTLFHVVEALFNQMRTGIPEPEAIDIFERFRVQLGSHPLVPLPNDWKQYTKDRIDSDHPTELPIPPELMDDFIERCKKFLEQ